MKRILPDKLMFDSLRGQLSDIIREWSERECSSFDDAVAEVDSSSPSTSDSGIWEMPAIDSKKVVSLLVEFESVVGCKIPVSVIRSGGYSDSDDLTEHLLATIRERCPDPSAPLLSVPADGGTLDKPSALVAS